MSDNATLAGRTALVTGASSGIGWATAMALAHKGANLVVTARREHRLRELCDLIAAASGKAAYVAGDAAYADTLADLRRRVRDWQRATSDPWTILYREEKAKSR